MKKRFLGTFLFVIFYAVILAGSTSWGQTSDGLDMDIIAPSIQHDPLSEPAVSGKDLPIMAKITDNQLVFETTIFYRHPGTNTYSRIPMSLGKDDIYSGIIPKDVIALPALEYYIQAEDRAGNIASRGFAVSPLTVLVKNAAPDLPAEVIDEAKSITDAQTSSVVKINKPWYKKWWVWGLTAVVVGAAAGGGGGGSSSGASGGGTGGVQVAW